jgi:serine/threonine protein kinase
MLHCPTCGNDFPDELKTCPQDNTLLQADATNVSALPVDPLLGRTLDDKYLLESRLGIGGMGTVYRAKHLLIDRAVAVKVLNPRFVEDEAAKARFRREAKAAGRLQHGNAVGVTDFGQTADGYVYIVMELLEGRTLRDLLSKEAPLDVARSVSIMMQVSAAVAAAHDAGIIHRDLKPANIFIVQRSDVPALVKVLDFGIAKIAADFLDEDDHLTLTQVGAMIGTPRYMSPEQCSGSLLTPAADVYSLGVILYEMLSGTVPFGGSTPLAIAMKHSTEVPRRPSEFVSSIPQPLEDVVLHALAKDPEDRPSSAEAFRQELYETAERLGLEHAGAASAPSIEALRSAGTESPSGRLVIDLGRLRENRATTSGASELTIVDNPGMPRTIEGTATSQGVLTSQQTLARRDHSRVNVNVNYQRARSRRRPVLLVGVAVVVLLLAAIAFLVGRSRGAPEVTNEVVAASPSPSPIETSPSPTPSPASAARQEQNRNSPQHKPDENKNQNKGSKVGRVFGKGKQILKKIF